MADPNQDDLDKRQMLRVYANYHAQLDARMPRLYLELVKRVEQLEASNQDLQQRVFELEHKLRKMQ